MEAFLNACADGGVDTLVNVLAPEVVRRSDGGGLVSGVAVLHEVPGGHGPWLEDPAGCAKLVADHFAATGFGPAAPVASGF
ncbi:MAG TPA: hypothetical protein VG253_13840 [Streptosporangiaceae bacterium]|nr:hypothetical protein [Streptosporangiaceae bacterium]